MRIERNNWEFYNLYYSLIISNGIKAEKGADHLVCIWESRNAYIFFVEKSQEKRPLGCHRPR
jgi:hypothetical protein